MAPGDKGNSYQKRWILYLALLAYEDENEKEFILRFEIPDAGAFDDVSLEIDGHTYLVQVKHTSNDGVITRGMLNREIGEKDAFSLLKYYESWLDIFKKKTSREIKNLHCILLTNYGLGKCSNLFENRKEDLILWKTLLNKHGRCLSLKETTKFNDDFKKFFSLITNQMSLEELDVSIQRLLKTKFANNTENVFNMLKTEITRLIHNEGKQGNRRDRRWLDGLFQIFREKNYLGWFTYIFNDSKIIYPDIKISATKTKMPDGRVVIILPYAKSYYLRMRQVQQMVNSKEFWYIPLAKLHTKLENELLIGMAGCTSDRILILHDLKDSDDFTFISKTIQKSSNMITKILIISNRNTREMRDAIESLSKKKHWIIKPDADEITLGDLKWNVNYDNFKVKFQGVEVLIRDLPSYNKIRANLCGDSLVDFIESKTLIIGNNLLNDNYQTRELSKIKYEFDYDGLNGSKLSDKNCDKYIVRKKGSIIKIKPITLSLIEEALERNTNDGLNDRIEDIVAKPLYDLFDTIVPYVEPHKCSGYEDVNEQSLINGFYTNGYKKLVIISGETGSGKSTTLKQLAKLHKEKYPKKWVVFINLCNHRFIGNGKVVEEMNQNWINNFLLTAITNNEISFEERYFKSCLPEDIVVFLDSFDEVCKKYVVKSFKLIQTLIDLKIFRIVIGSRHYQEVMLFNQWPDCEIYHLGALNFKTQLEMLKQELLSENNVILSKDHERTLLHLQSELKNKSPLKIGESLVIHMLARNICSDPKYATKSFTIFDVFETYIASCIEKFECEKLGLRRDRDQASYDEDNFYKRMSLCALKEELGLDIFKRIVPKTTQEKLNKPSPQSGFINALTPPNLKCKAIKQFFFAYSMHKQYINLEVIVFWGIFQQFFDQNSLDRYFFFHQLSKRLLENFIIDRDRKKCEDLLNIINHISEEEKKLPGIKERYEAIRSTRSPS